MGSSILSKIVLLCLANIVLFPYSQAIMGNYRTVPEIMDKRLPIELDKLKIKDQKKCEHSCIMNEICEAYSISEFEETCYLHKLILGTRPVKHLGYNLFVRTRSIEDGYHIYKTDYIKLIFDIKDFASAIRHCETIDGTLVTIKDRGLNDLLVEMMASHVIFRVFIGLTDKEKEGEWRYVGEETPASFKNFAYNGQWERFDKNCAIIQSSGEWFHENCRNPHQFFCQIPMF